MTPPAHPFHSRWNNSASNSHSVCIFFPARDPRVGRSAFLCRVTPSLAPDKHTRFPSKEFIGACERLQSNRCRTVGEGAKTSWNHVFSLALPTSVTHTSRATLHERSTPVSGGLYLFTPLRSSALLNIASGSGCFISNRTTHGCKKKKKN